MKDMANDELPEGWAKCLIGEISPVVGGGTPPSKDVTNFTQAGGIPWLTPADLSGYREIYISRGARNLTDKGFSESSAKMLPKGALLFSSRAPVGYVAIASNPVCTNQGFKSFVLPKGFDSRFGYYYLRHIKPLAEDMATGTTFKELSGGTAAQLPFVIAPLAEQKRIADKLEAVLGRVDACRARLDRVPDLLKRFRQSVLAAATSGQLTEDWREENKATFETPPHEVVADDLEELPSGWFWSCPEKIRKDERYALAIGPFGSNLKVSDYRESGVPLVFVREIRSRSFGGSNTKFVTCEKAEELKAHSASGGDLLITKMGDPPGDVAVYPTHAPTAIITADCIKLRVDSAKAKTTFVSYVIESPQARARLLDIVAGVAQQKISLERFRDFPLQVAPLPEQAEIVRRVEALFALADRIEARLTAARAQVERLTPATLSKAFRGDLVPQDPNDEPASKLLERLGQSIAATGKNTRKAVKAR